MSDKIETPAADTAAGTKEATAAAADTKTTAVELKAAKKELADKDKLIKRLETEIDGLSTKVDEKDELLLEADIQVRNLVKERDALKLENEALQAIPKAEDDRILYTSVSGDTYQVTHPTFKFKGSEYKAAELIEEGDIEILEQLIEAKAFILKKV